jgi:hypothetical protein
MREECRDALSRVLRIMALGMLVAVGWTVAAPSAWADPPGRVGRIAETHGTVWVYAPDQQEWVQAEVNRPLTTGDRLALDHDARAEVTIGSTTVRLDSDSQLDVTELDDEHMRLQLDQGGLAARLRDPQAATQFEVTTAQGRFTPQQPGHYRIDIGDDETLALAWSGSLRFDARDSTLSVTAGRRAELWQEDGVTHYSWADLPHDDFSDWVLAADHRDELAASRQRYVPMDMTGWEDLDRAGRWETTADYGTVWIPLQVAPGWAPYQQGHWVWVSPWGWTWVDDAPWGFAPFHYGRWVWWGQRWCWVPGRYRYRPVYAPALVGWVGASPVYTGVGSAPLVGWVPLAPGEVYYPGYAVGPGHWHALNPHDPRRSYRPAPPPRVNANFVNSHAPGAVTLMPAASFVQARPSIGVAPHDPRDPHDGRPHWPHEDHDGHGAGPGWHEGQGAPRGGNGASRPAGGLVAVAPPPAPSHLVPAPTSAAVPAPPNMRRRPPFVRPPARGAENRAQGGAGDAARGGGHEAPQGGADSAPWTGRPGASVPGSSMPVVRSPSVAPGTPVSPAAPGGSRGRGGHEDRPVPVIRSVPGELPRVPAADTAHLQDGHRSAMPVPHPHPAPPASAGGPAGRAPTVSPPETVREPVPHAPRAELPRPPAPVPQPHAVPPAPSSIVTRVAPQVVRQEHPAAAEKPAAPGRDERPQAPGEGARRMQP